MASNKTSQLNLPLLSQKLFLNVAEELKTPLMQIARMAEQSRMDTETNQKVNHTIQTTADYALQLIDNYILGVSLSLDPQHLITESVSVSSVLYDTGSKLQALANNYGVDLELNISGRYGPVLANKNGLEAALVSLGSALIEALPASGNKQLKLQLAMHRSRYGLVAGVYADTKQISAQVLKSGRRLLVTSRQPLVGLTHSSGAGIFVADTILRAMNLNLITSRHHSLYGIGTVLQPNHQLQLVP